MSKKRDVHLKELVNAGIPLRANDNLCANFSSYIDTHHRNVINGTVLPLCIDEEMLISRVEKACQGLLEALFIDTENDHNTKDTARRMAKMYVTEVFKGRYQPMPSITAFPNVKNVDQIYTVGPATIRSACSHHMVPIMGEAWIGILPEKTDGKVLGLSKFVRLAEWIFARPQIQEEGTEMLSDVIWEVVQPRGLAVVVRAAHMCMTWRGVRETQTTMVTSSMRGAFKEDAKAREEFFNLIKGQGY